MRVAMIFDGFVTYAAVYLRAREVSYGAILRKL